MTLGTFSLAFAYIGPGPGLSMTWALLALVGTVLSALVAVLFWPVKVMLRRLRDGSDETGDGSGALEREA